MGVAFFVSGGMRQRTTPRESLLRSESSYHKEKPYLSRDRDSRLNNVLIEKGCGDCQYRSMLRFCVSTLKLRLQAQLMH